MWNGPFPILGVCHPDTFQQLNKQALSKARGLTDGYRLLVPWLGNFIVYPKKEHQKKIRYYERPVVTLQLQDFTTEVEIRKS